MLAKLICSTTISLKGGFASNNQTYIPKTIGSLVKYFQRILKVVCKNWKNTDWSLVIY